MYIYLTASIADFCSLLFSAVLIVLVVDDARSTSYNAIHFPILTFPNSSLLFRPACALHLNQVNLSVIDFSSCRGSFFALSFIM